MSIDARELDDLLGTLLSREGVDAQAAMYLRTGETVAAALGALALDDTDDSSVWVRVGSASFAIDTDKVYSAEPFAGPDRIGVTVELPLYELTIHWTAPQGGDR